MSRSIFGNITQTNNLSSGGIINGSLQIDDNLIAESLEVGLLGQRYSLPTTKGLSSQVITRSSIDDSTNWETPQSFDQDLNTDSNTQFKNCILSVNDDVLSPSLTFDKTRGDIFNPATVEINDVVGSIKYQGRNIGGFTQLCAKIEVNATEDFLIGQNATSISMYTVDDATVTLKEKIKIHTLGLTINPNTGISYTLPNYRGSANQYLEDTLGDGVLNWSNISTYDQSLNTTDGPTFETLRIVGDEYQYLTLGHFIYNSRNANFSQGFGIVNFRSRGTRTTPTALINNDRFMEHSFSGHDGTTYKTSCKIDINTTENWSTNNNGTEYILYTTDNGSGTITEKIKCSSDGVTLNNAYSMPKNQGINNQVLTSNGAGLVEWITPATANPFDQSLNVADDVDFSNVKINSKWDISNADGSADLIFSNDDDRYQLLFQNGATRSFRSQNSPNPNILSLNKSRGTLSNPTNIDNGDNIGNIEHRSYDSSGFQACVETITKATQNHSSGNLGAEWKLTTCDNNSNVLKTKITANSSGVSFNDPGNTINFPSVRGTNNQIMKTDASGVLSWYTPFIPYSYNYQTSVDSTVMISTDGLTVITDTIKQTSIMIEEIGTYNLLFNGLFDLSGNLQQQLSTRADAMAVYLSGLSYNTMSSSITNASPAHTIYGPGYYKSVGAETITGNLELQGNGTGNSIFVFYINGALTMNANTSIVFVNSAQPKNLFFVVDGVFSTFQNCIVNGNFLVGTTISIGDNNTITSRLISLSGAITLGNGSQVPTLPPDTSPLIGFLVLSNYSLYTKSGAITKTGTIANSTTTDIMTGSGSITNFSGSIDGTYSSGITQAKVHADMGFYVQNVYVPTSGRCIRSDLTTCYNQTMFSRITTIAPNEVVTVKCEVLLANTSITAKNRCINANRVYF